MLVFTSIQQPLKLPPNGIYSVKDDFRNGMVAIIETNSLVFTVGCKTLQIKYSPHNSGYQFMSTYSNNCPYFNDPPFFEKLFHEEIHFQTNNDEVTLVRTSN
eukprot:GHVR01081700.1.p1 GENE.GHVR01081700.1~~GHVR01081700.1.p1  ORF type:complete len:102 (+),score=3.58 GHVR01081700.1:796-1101(+)